MLSHKKIKAKDSHILIFGFIFIVFLCFTAYKFTSGVTLDPGNITIHTSIVYYDNRFSSDYTVLDTKSALYFLNQSSENVYATVFEYDKNFKEVKYFVVVNPGQSQYIKTDGQGTVYLQNQSGTATSIAKFSRWSSSKRYQVPDNFSF